jgi:hypothetical protein
MPSPDIKNIVAQYQWFQQALEALLAEPIRPLPAVPPRFGIGSSAAAAELQRSFEKLAIRYHELRREIDASRLPPERDTRPPAWRRRIRPKRWQYRTIIAACRKNSSDCRRSI